MGGGFSPERSTIINPPMNLSFGTLKLSTLSAYRIVNALVVLIKSGKSKAVYLSEFAGILSALEHSSVATKHCGSWPKIEAEIMSVTPGTNSEPVPG